MKKAGLLFSILILVANGAKAQLPLAMYDSLTFINNDTVPYGDAVLYTSVVKNESSTTYNDWLGVKMMLDTTSSQGADTAHFIFINTEWLNGGNQVTLLPGDTIDISDTIFINAQFKNGINTVVIWPINNTEHSVGRDSAKFDLLVFDPLNVSKAVSEEVLTLYPNPFSDKIWLLTKGNTRLEQVRIIDAMGKLILVEDTPQKSYVETGNLLQGVYFIELTYSSGHKKRIKVIKQ
ncbi:MAG TPA: T9SS type A sorting domain-containing protein [Bacteroidia bacterium]